MLNFPDGKSGFPDFFPFPTKNYFPALFIRFPALFIRFSGFPPFPVQSGKKPSAGKFNPEREGEGELASKRIISMHTLRKSKKYMHLSQITTLCSKSDRTKAAGVLGPKSAAAWFQP